MITDGIRSITCSRSLGRALARVAWSTIGGFACSIAAYGSVIEFYNPDLNNFFITADPIEQAFVDTGAVGHWQRTGYAFETGGPNQVCRFYGNGNVNPVSDHGVVKLNWLRRTARIDAHVDPS